jgi:hypothetical protein
LLGDISGVTTITIGGFQKRYLSRARYEKGLLLGAKNLNAEELWQIRKAYLGLTESGESKNILTILLPPNQFNNLEHYKHRVVRPVQEAVNECLVGDWSVRHAPHPRLSLEAEALWSRTYSNADFDESREPVTLQIARSSLVLGFSSALLRFCVDLDVKAIDFDVFKYHYEDYSTEPIVSRAGSLTELQNALLSASRTAHAGSRNGRRSSFAQQSNEGLHDLGELLRALE